MDPMTTVDGDMKMCRICLESEYELRSIYKMGKILDQCVKLCDVLSECTSLVFDANDKLPGYLCRKCLMQVSKIFIFRQLAFQSNLVLRQKLSTIEKLDAEKVDSDHSDHKHKQNETIADDDMEYVTVFLSSENQIDGDNEQMQYFDQVELDDYSETIDSKVDFDTDSVEMEVADDECNSYIESSFIDKSIASDKQTVSTMSGTDYSADDSAPVSMHGGDGDRVQISARKQRIRRRQNSSLKSFKCDICGKVLSNQSSHKYHMQLHSAATPFLCNECGDGFKTRNAYDGHMVTHLPANPNKCEICGKTYRQAASLRCHMLAHTGEKPFMCGICGKGMTQKSGFKKHMLTHTGEKPHNCDICGKDFRYSSNLINHRRAHLGERNFSCETCEKTFVGSEQLKRHMLIHTGEKPFKCDICDKNFNRKSTLQIHKKTHNDGRKNYCKICGKMYVKAQYLEAHMNTVHNK